MDWLQEDEFSRNRFRKTGGLELLLRSRLPGEEGGSMDVFQSDSRWYILSQ